LFITYAVLTLAVRSDGIQNIGLAILPVLILVGSLVLDRLTLVFFTASIILAVVGMLAIRYFVLMAERYSTNDMGRDGRTDGLDGARTQPALGRDSH
jgi:hypothetical protein